MVQMQKSEVTVSASLLLVSEGLIVVLLLIRRPTDNISISFKDWFVAFSGSFLPLLVRKGEEPLVLYLAVGLMIFGMVTHIGAKLSLFRSFGIVPANRGVKVKGLYTIVRHPMYAGYFYTHIGFLLSTPSVWNLVVYTSTWGFMLPHIFLEEKILLQSPEYQEYVNRVRYRLIPGVF
jgi:protein-S-isoprenylcysteine O-methyltransferase Ste14